MASWGYASVKKGDLAASAERIFAGATIAEVEVRERALAWVPDVMRFGGQAHAHDELEDTQPQSDAASNGHDADDSVSPPRDLAA